MEDIKQVSIYEKLQNARSDINEETFAKSGYNKFGDFHYHELGDFMPFIMKACKTSRITPLFNFYTGATLEGKEREMARLEIFDWDSEQTIILTSHVAGFSNKKMQPIQELNSRHTFMKRYLYSHAFEISEKSVVDIIQEQEEVKEDIETSKKKVEDRIKENEKLKGDEIPPTSVQQILAMAKSKGFTKEDIIARHNKLKKSSVKKMEDIPNADRYKYYNSMKKGKKK